MKNEGWKERDLQKKKKNLFLSSENDTLVLLEEVLSLKTREFYKIFAIKWNQNVNITGGGERGGVNNDLSKIIFYDEIFSIE